MGDGGIWDVEGIILAREQGFDFWNYLWSVMLVGNGGRLEVDMWMWTCGVAMEVDNIGNYNSGLS